MLYSMTGYGRAEAILKDKTCLIEVKSLNGKQFDVRLNCPSLLKPYEVEIRNKLNENEVKASSLCRWTQRTYAPRLIKNRDSGFRRIASRLCEVDCASCPDMDFRSQVSVNIS